MHASSWVRVHAGSWAGNGYTELAEYKLGAAPQAVLVTRKGKRCEGDPSDPKRSAHAVDKSGACAELGHHAREVRCAALPSALRCGMQRCMHDVLACTMRSRACVRCSLRA